MLTNHNWPKNNNEYFIVLLSIVIDASVSVSPSGRVAAPLNLVYYEYILRYPDTQHSYIYIHSPIEMLISFTTSLDCEIHTYRPSCPPEPKHFSNSSLRHLSR